MNDKKVQILYGLFVGLLVGVNLMGGKIISFLGVSASVGIFMVPLLFLITDIVTEVQGEETAKQFVLGGILALTITLLYAAVFVALPSHERYSFHTEYTTIFGSSLRMILASLVAFIVSQYHDVFAFAWWKQRTHGKALWIRNNLSTIVSQAIDTFLFMMIAFYQLTPKFHFLFVLKLCVPYYLLKVVFAVLDTPFVYLGVKWMKKQTSQT